MYNQQGAMDFSQIIKAIKHSSEIHSLGGRKIVQIDDETVVKYGDSINLQEADNIKFIRERTNIPVPEIKATFAENGITYIVMSKVPGKSLIKVWSYIKHKQKVKVMLDLKKYVEELRNISPEKENYIGGINETSCFDVRRHDRIGGPFNSEQEFNNFLLSGILIKNRVKPISEMLKTNHRIVFTHGDLTPRNIMVQSVPSSLHPGGITLEITGIIDWEYSGWYPEYWEYIKSLSSTINVKEWRYRYVPMFMDPYPDEFAVDCSIDVVTG